MGLKIEQTWAQIGLKSSLPQLKLQIQEPQLEIKETLPEVQIEQQAVRIQCDATQCREEIGLRTPLAYSRYIAQKGWQESLAFIAQKARTGDLMARIDKHNISAVMAHLGSQAFDNRQFNIARIPSSPVKVEVTPPELQINWQMGDLQIQPRNGDVTANLVRGEVNVFLRQEASINIQYLGEKVDISS